MKHKSNTKMLHASCFRLQENSGLSLIEAVVGIALMSMVFISFFGALKLAINIVGTSRARAGALALANEQMESIRNLPYNEVGTEGGIPSGDISQQENIILNKIDYTRRTLIQYVDDTADGEGEDDENGVTADYKRARIEISWQNRNSAQSVVLVSDMMPKGIETIAGGGTLKIEVFDASINMVVSASVHIENNLLDPLVSIDTFTNSEGRVVFPGSPSSVGYEVFVTKTGYSSAQTYDETVENVDPRPPHVTILEGGTSEVSFVIDLLSQKTIKTYSSPDTYIWSDSFEDESKVSATSSAIVLEGEVKLASTTESGYELSGFLVSETLIPEALEEWQSFSFNDVETASTTINYQLFFASSTDWILIPDEDLAGNSSGFAESPLDLTSLSVSQYPEVRLRANLSTIDASTTPSLLDWQAKWKAGRIPLPLMTFNMRGEKIIGYGSGGSLDPIYKYSEDLITDNDGSLIIEDLEWDVYTITTNGVITDYDIAEACPFQPVSVVPDSTNLTELILVPHAGHTLLVSVEDSDSVFIPGANIRLYRSGYDETKFSSGTCGQVFFSSLSQAVNYTIEVTKPGYENFSLSGVEINGQTIFKAVLSSL